MQQPNWNVPKNNHLPNRPLASSTECSTERRAELTQYDPKYPKSDIQPDIDRNGHNGSNVPISIYRIQEIKMQWQLKLPSLVNRNECKGKLSEFLLLLKRNRI